MQPLHGAIGCSVSVRIVSRACKPRALFCRHLSSLKKVDELRLRRRAVDPHCNMSGETNYNSWTKTGLIQRLKELETELKKRPQAPEPAPRSQNVSATDDAALLETKHQPGGETKPKVKRKMDPSRYSSRFIALKLAYLGKNYGGFEFQAMGNQPSIEEELWQALTKSCLIFPEDDRIVQFDCCEYSKCGRTDRGVSAFGQVIGIRVRSNRPLPKKRAKMEDGGGSVAETTATAEHEESPDEMVEDMEEPKPFDDIQDELCYPRILNRLLPDDIRVLAWCASPPPEFSARFSCRERQYRYYFTQPAFAPEPSSLAPASRRGDAIKTGWLDIEAMRDAAKRFEGDNDFRNFCKIDPAKQINNYCRRIFEADIVEVEDASSALPYLQNSGFAASSLNGTGPYPKVYYFHVRGSAFLWHQIRHMVAILFLVGQRLESPSVVSELLDTEKNPARPHYVMADEVPLVLWDCVFPDLAKGDYAAAELPGKREDSLEWIYVGDEYASNKFGQFGVMDSMWQLWRGHKMDELLSSQLLQLISGQGKSYEGEVPSSAAPTGNSKAVMSKRVFEGGNGGRLGGRYVPVMKKELMQTPDEQNEKYAKRKGYADAADMRARKFGAGKDEDQSME